MRKILLVAAFLAPATFALAESDAGLHAQLEASSGQARAAAPAAPASDARAERVATEAAQGQNGQR